MHIICSKSPNRLIIRLAKLLNANFLDHTTKSFSNKEFFANLPNRPEKVLIEFPKNHSINDSIMELLMMLDILSSYEISLNLLIPYMPYSRQDKRLDIGDSFGLKVFADMLNNFNLDKIITFDIHSKESLKLFKSEIINLTPYILFDEPLKQHNTKDSIVLATDQGGEHRAKLLSDLIQCNYVVPMKKRQGNLVEHSLNNEKSLEGKNIIIVDDIIDTGKTILSILSILNHCNVNSIYIYATHIVSENSINLIEENKSVKKIYTSTELDRPSLSKIELIDCSRIIVPDLFL